MNSEKPDHQKLSQYSISLHPYRSMEPRAFLILMVFIGIISFGAGLIFLLMGAWPILGFFGLDILLIYLAFRLNYRAGRKCEIVEIYEDQLNVRMISPNGRESSRKFQAYWSRIEIHGDRLFIRCKSEQLEIGHFLIGHEKEEVKEALTSALYTYRHGSVA